MPVICTISKCYISSERGVGCFGIDRWAGKVCVIVYLDLILCGLSHRMPRKGRRIVVKCNAVGRRRQSGRWQRPFGLEREFFTFGRITAPGP